MGVGEVGGVPFDCHKMILLCMVRHSVVNKCLGTALPQASRVKKGSDEIGPIVEFFFSSRTK